MRTSKAVGRRANGKGGEVDRQTEENDEKGVVGMVEPKVQLIRVNKSIGRANKSIGRSYDEIKGVAMSVSRNFHMLSDYNWQEGRKIGLFEYRRGRPHGC